MIICSVYIPILTDLFHQLIQIDKDEIKEIEDDTRKWVQIIVFACEKNNIEWTKKKKFIQMFKSYLICQCGVLLNQVLG